MANFAQLHVREYPDPGTLTWRGRFVHNWFSNFDAVGAPVDYRGFRTTRLELPFVAAKNPDQVVATADGSGSTTFVERVFSAPTPGDAKRLGQRNGIVDLREDWDEVNIAAMDFFLRQRWRADHRDSLRLASLPAPIVEWNNWGDDRWGATVRNRRGRNALGLLLDAICVEIRAGDVRPGADERFWAERQVELVEALNAMSPETVLGRGPAPARPEPPPPSQMSLF